MKIRFSLLTCLISLLVFPSVALAILGVGVGTGKIVIDEAMFPGTIYQLPNFTVVNTGDEPSNYEVGVQYHEQQPEKRPAESWFIFTPKQFYLEPGKVQVIDMKLNLPVRVEPGDYFAYLEGRPVVKAETGVTRIGIAAATKIYFKVKPANVVLGAYYKGLTFWRVYAPWPARVSAVLGVILAALVLKHFFNFDLKIAKKSPEVKKEIKVRALPKKYAVKKKKK